MRLLTGFLIVGSLVVGLVGCGTGVPDDTGPRFVSYAEMAQEYQAAVDGYPNPLPAGKAFPARPRPPSEPTIFEVGEGGNTADFFWICSWVGEWLTTRGTDPQRAAEAMAWVDKASDTRLHREHYYDPENVWGNDIVGLAELGDITNLRDWYANGCAAREGLGPIA